MTSLNLDPVQQAIIETNLRAKEKLEAQQATTRARVFHYITEIREHLEKNWRQEIAGSQLIDGTPTTESIIFHKLGTTQRLFNFMCSHEDTPDYDEFQEVLLRELNNKIIVRFATEELKNWSLQVESYMGISIKMVHGGVGE